MIIFRKTLALCFWNIYIIGSDAGNPAELNIIKGLKMRQAFFECKYRYQAVKEMPWASVIVKVCGGYRGFESVTDYEIWKNQK